MSSYLLKSDSRKLAPTALIVTAAVSSSPPFQVAVSESPGPPIEVVVSNLAIAPFCPTAESLIEIAGLVPPELSIGSTPVTEETPPATALSTSSLTLFSWSAVTTRLVAELVTSVFVASCTAPNAAVVAGVMLTIGLAASSLSVSYTHLTLPTILLV